ncbi:hypothetical protein FXE05_03850 [Aggregatibacter actinomycetemcomitans]|uniref:hypothetical protein n=1 Tax=Aggregatibacter actinomycetemcomitans TaxID=714 RepID=UPI0011D8EA1B|nr:hypothetical protein [Aggregatibacter actinomycetemcomitans]TYA25546.1 hypothetical protein FXE05_03850 [Aggregatibacter actinomycetemcomitans]
MSNHDQFLSSFKNHSEPLISFKDLILSISIYTNKTVSQVADRLESLLFGFRQNGKYINSFCYCTIFDKRSEPFYTYEPITNYFADGFDNVKGWLKDVVVNNSIDVPNIDQLFVRRIEIAKQIKDSDLSLLDKAEPNQLHQITQIKGDYISLYDFIEWAKIAGNHENLTDTVNDILRILGEQNVVLYREYGGLKPCIEKDKQSLKKALQFVAINNDYSGSDEIPF